MLGARIPSMISGGAVGWSLGASRRATLAAVAARLAPHAFVERGRATRLVAELEARIGRMSPPLRSDFGVALDVLGSRWAALAAGLRPLPFAALRAAEQDALLRRWSASRLSALRTVMQAVRRFVLLLEYGTAEAQTEVGYRGPLHLRGPEVSWEGPLPGTSSDAEPVARSASPMALGSLPAPARSPLRDVPVPSESRLRVEVLVIGSGAGGAVAACRLAEAGHDVLVLEAGALISDHDFDEHELTALEKLYAEGGLRSTDDLSVNVIQGAVVGGGTTVNWMIMLRTPDHVLDEWAARHGAEGMTARDLAAVFDQVEREVHAKEVPDDAHSPSNRALLEGAARLGWKARAGRINAKNCVRAGFCGYGCRYDAKQGALLTFLPRAVAAGARLMHGARAERIECIEREGAFPLKRVTIAQADAHGATRTVVVETPVVIVAGGAVETPVLLQRSGLGGGAVGRFLRLHPTSAVMGRYDREMYVSGGIPLSAVCDEYANFDGNGYGFWVECPQFHPAQAAAAIPGFGTSHRESMLQFRNTGAFITLVRDGADINRSNGDVRAGRAGRVQIRYRVGSADRRHLVAAITAGARLHLAAGAIEVRTLHSDASPIRNEGDLAALAALRYGPNDVALYSAHVNGTCRLGVDPASSGTNPDGERWHARGVFVADGSLLPTAPGVNPQETIMALATVVAGRISARRRPG